LCAVLVFIIPAAWLAVVIFGLTLFRAAARSDASHAHAVAEWVATSSDVVSERLPIDPERAAYRATG
jgi:hypothetical protein